MALVILGRTVCVLCGLVLSKGDDIVMFPAGLFERDDPAFLVNDAGVHQGCLSGKRFGVDALQRRQEYIDQVEGIGK